MGNFYLFVCSGGGQPDGSFSKWICGATGTNIRLRKINIRLWRMNIPLWKMNISLYNCGWWTFPCRGWTFDCMVQCWHSLDICRWLNISICLRDKPKCRQHLFDWWLIYSQIFIPRNTSHCCNSYCDLINENWMNYSHWYLKGKIWTPILSLVFWACLWTPHQSENSTLIQIALWFSWGYNWALVNP